MDSGLTVNQSQNLNGQFVIVRTEQVRPEPKISQTVRESSSFISGIFKVQSKCSAFLSCDESISVYY